MANERQRHADLGLGPFRSGRRRALSEIRWQFSQTGSADQYAIEVSGDGASWQTLATRGNASATGAWQSLPATATARYVRFTFANPNRDRRLGFLGAVQIFGSQTSQRSANVSSESRREEDARQAGPPAMSSEYTPAAGRSRKRNQKRRRGGRGRRG